MTSKIRSILNRFRWDANLKNEQKHVMITYIHRGADNDKKTVFLTEIEDILPAFFTIPSEEFPKEKTNIPFHRILEIKNKKTGEILYRKK